MKHIYEDEFATDRLFKSIKITRKQIDYEIGDMPNDNNEDTSSEDDSTRADKNPIDVILDMAEQMSAEKMNRLIADALFLIRKNSVGIYEKVLLEELKITGIEYKIIRSKIVRLEDIVEENEDWDEGVPKMALKSITSNNGNISDEYRLKQEIKEIKKQSSERIEKEKIKKQSSERIEKEKIQKENAPEIEKITTKMVEEYLHWKHSIIKQLKFTVIGEYQKYRSLSKIYELHPNDTKERIRRHVITDLRLPTELKILENEGGLHPNPICSIIIALYATDYFHWDRENKNEKDIIKLAKNISRYLQSDIKLNRLFQEKK